MYKMHGITYNEENIQNTNAYFFQEDKLDIAVIIDADSSTNDYSEVIKAIVEGIKALDRVSADSLKELFQNVSRKQRIDLPRLGKQSFALIVADGERIIYSFAGDVGIYKLHNDELFLINPLNKKYLASDNSFNYDSTSLEDIEDKILVYTNIEKYELNKTQILIEYMASPDAANWVRNIARRVLLNENFMIESCLTAVIEKLKTNEER